MAVAREIPAGPPPRGGAMPEHLGGILWLTGLPAAGKSTLAFRLERRLAAAGWRVVVLDGDVLRRGLCADLGYSPCDRAENVRRAGEAAALFAQAGLLAICAFISPCRADRERLRQAHPRWFREVHVQAPLEACEARDPKGLYRRARAGEVAAFTGVSAPYEPPQSPGLVLHTDRETVEESLARLVDYAEREFAAAPEGCAGCGPRK